MLADVLHRYHIWIKGVEDNPLPDPEVTRGKYEKGDVVWVKNPCGKCTTKNSTGCVTEVISPQSVKIDGVPHHVKDLRPVIQMQLSSSDESDSEDSECLIYLNSDLLDSDSDASSLPTDEVSIETQTADKSTHEDEACVIPLWRSTQQRQKLPPCPVCDHEIWRECRENRDLPDSRVAAFCTVQSLNKKKLKWWHTVAFVFAYLMWSNADSRCSYANETVRCYKKNRGGNRNDWKQGVLQQDCLSQWCYWDQLSNHRIISIRQEYLKW